jgi:drug/metabolite transporter (DMT)-like permease
MIGVIILNFLFSVNLILRKIILDCTQPLFFQGIRLTGAGVILLGYLYFYNRPLLRFQRHDVGLFFQAALFFAYLSYVLSVITLDDLSSARFAFMFNLSPFITALICFFYLHESLNRREIASLVIGFIGFMPLMFVGKQDGIESVGFLSMPGLQLFLSTIAYAYGWIVVSQLVKERKYSPLLVTGIAFFCGGMATLLTSFIFEDWLTVAPVSNLFKFTTYLIAIIFISEIIASNMYAALLKRYSATFLSFAGFLYPLFSALLGWFFLEEKITYNFFVSAIIVGLALYIFQLSEKNKIKGTLS